MRPAGDTELTPLAGAGHTDVLLYPRYGRLLPSSATVELSIADTGEKGVPLGCRECENGAVRVSAVTDPDNAFRQASYLNAVAVGVAQRTFFPV
jgi:hypothetical protein